MRKLNKRDRFVYRVKYGVFRYGKELAPSGLGLRSHEKQEVDDYVYALNVSVYGISDFESKFKDSIFKVGQVKPEKIDLAQEAVTIEATKVFDIESKYIEFGKGEITLDQLNATLNAANVYVNAHIDHVTEDDIKKLDKYNNSLAGATIFDSLEEKTSVKFTAKTPTGGRKAVMMSKVINEPNYMAVMAALFDDQHELFKLRNTALDTIKKEHPNDVNISEKWVVLKLKQLKLYDRYQFAVNELLESKIWNENPIAAPDQTGWTPYTGGSGTTLFKNKNGYVPTYLTLSHSTVFPAQIKRVSVNRSKKSDEQIMNELFKVNNRNVKTLIVYARNIGATNKQSKRLYAQIKAMCNGKHL